MNGEPSIEKLGANDVHLWCVTLSACGADDRDLRCMLSREERERADRFRFQPDWDRYVRSHGALRLILARYLGSEPQSVRFSASGLGKPELAGNGAGPGVTFNMSHSTDMMLLGVALGRRIGVDVEFVSNRVDVHRIAERYFRREERDSIFAGPVERRLQSFYQHWTCKEAYGKATGLGLAAGLNDCTTAGTYRTAVLRTGSVIQSRVFEGWTIYSLQPAEGYHAAVVVEGSDLALDVKSAGRQGAAFMAVQTGASGRPVVLHRSGPEDAAAPSAGEAGIR